jgi:integration host factor subunit alpha
MSMISPSLDELFNTVEAPTVSRGAVTRTDLAAAVYRRAGVSRAGAYQFVAMVLTEILEALSRGDSVKLASFGSFVVRCKRERVGRNPKTGIEAPITARRVVVFKASTALRGRANRKPIDGGRSE